MIAPCLYEIHHDPKNFPEPHSFTPSRFLDSSGQKFLPHPALVPYGFGKRDNSHMKSAQWAEFISAVCWGF